MGEQTERTMRDKELVFDNTYYDLNEKKTELTKDELEYFQGVVKEIKEVLKVDYPIVNRNHEVEMPKKSKEALGVFYTSDKKDPKRDCFITIDNFFIHECYEEKFHGSYNFTFQSLEEVICHEIAHSEQFQHCKKHSKIAKEMLEKVMTRREIRLLSEQVREEMESKYGVGTDLAGYCIEASEKLAKRIHEQLGLNAVTVEGWCRYDDDYYGSDYPWDPHTWVEIPEMGIYADVTADQFNYGMDIENEFSGIVVQEGLPHGMQYEEPSWDEIEVNEISLDEIISLSKGVYQGGRDSRLEHKKDDLAR